MSAAEVIQHARAQGGQGGEAAAKRSDAGGAEVSTWCSRCCMVTYGEDGTVQGLLELANIAYVGPGVLASAAGMDKAVMKVLFTARGLPVCPWHGFVRPEWDRDRDGVVKQIEKLGLPVFVKPANLGSSVGISKVKTRDALVPAMNALQFDRKGWARRGPNAREIEGGVGTRIRRRRAGEFCPRASSTIRSEVSR